MTGTFESFLSEHKSGVNLSSLLPYAGLVPRDPAENASWREWIAACGASSEADRALIFGCCRADLLFFINSFLMIKQESPVVADLPFITWPRQEEYVRLLVESRRRVELDKSGKERGDTLAEKPREVGWTWLTESEGLQIALFEPGSTCLLGSRVAKDVDAADSSKTLFYKLDYFIENLPRWFISSDYWSAKEGWPVPSKRYRTHEPIKLKIPGGGTLLGDGTQENFGRSGRYQWMMLDEFAHTDRGQVGMGDKIWGATTKTCRVRRVVSTPNGRLNKFADLRFGGSLPVFSVHWTDDPAKMVDAYQLTDEMDVGPVTLKAGDWWSPWAESTRKSDDNDRLFAQEILLSYEGLGGGFYDSWLSRVKYEQVRDPVWVGNVEIEDGRKGPRVSRWVDHLRGMVEVWDESFLSLGMKFPPGIYFMGMDVASGTRDKGGRGSSNSAISVGRLEGRKLVKVLQYRTHGLFAHLFSRIACAVGWCFEWPGGRPAYAIWESNGPGETMGYTLVQTHGYPHYFTETSKSSGDRSGFQMQAYRLGDGELAGSRVNVFNEHIAWLTTGDYVEPSMTTYLDMEQYRCTEDAGAEHRKRRASLDPSEGRDNHGDTVISTILMIWAARQYRQNVSEVKTEPVLPYGTLAYHQKQRGRQLAGAWLR